MEDVVRNEETLLYVRDRTDREGFSMLFDARRSSPLLPSIFVLSANRTYIEGISSVFEERVFRFLEYDRENIFNGTGRKEASRLFAVNARAVFRTFSFYMKILRERDI